MADDVVVQEVCANLLGAVLGLGSWVSGLRSQVWGVGPVSPGGSVTQRGRREGEGRANLARWPDRVRVRGNMSKQLCSGVAST
jgi:hypothetical protein